MSESKWINDKVFYNAMHGFLESVSKCKFETCISHNKFCEK